MQPNSNQSNQSNSRPTVICFSGKARHGKDTFAEFMTSSVVNQKHSSKPSTVKSIAYADILKFIATKYYDWDGNKDERGRTLLQQIARNFRKFNSELLIEHLKVMIMLLAETYDYILITDCRFPKEILSVKELCSENNFRFKNYHLLRLGYESELTPEQQSDVTETALDQFFIDNHSNDWFRTVLNPSKPSNFVGDLKHLKELADKEIETFELLKIKKSR